MKPLASLDQLEAALNDSAQNPIFLFKHSTACPISQAALHEVDRYSESRRESDPVVYMVRVIEERPVSNSIAERLDVLHKSPQIILVDDGKAVWNASHHGIYERRLHEAATGTLETK
ncbi:MAG: hypothetical protein AMXMBFR84_43840 [Candidatus Hydrogenedentota bacterium]